MCEGRDWGAGRRALSQQTPQTLLGGTALTAAPVGEGCQKVGPVCDLLVQGEYTSFFPGVLLPGPGLALHPPGAGLAGPSWQHWGLEASAPPGILLN